MARERVTTQQIRDYVLRLGEQHPPIPLSSVDYTVKAPEAVRDRYGHVFEYLSRIELEVDRNVLELLTLMPSPEEVDVIFYADVWQPQEIQHGIILDHVQQQLGLPASEPLMEVGLPIEILGALSHIPAVQDVSRLIYYLTGASTERQAVLAYSEMIKGLHEMGEGALEESVIHPIKQQEPGHFAFYRMSATQMVQDGRMKPWQLFLARTLRQASYTLVGVDTRRETFQDMGGVMDALGITNDLPAYAKEIGRLEARLLWANKNGMEFPPYFLKALEDCLAAFREDGLGTTGKWKAA